MVYKSRSLVLAGSLYILVIAWQKLCVFVLPLFYLGRWIDFFWMIYNDDGVRIKIVDIIIVFLRYFYKSLIWLMLELCKSFSKYTGHTFSTRLFNYWRIWKRNVRIERDVIYFALLEIQTSVIITIAHKHYMNKRENLGFFYSCICRK